MKQAKWALRTLGWQGWMDWQGWTASLAKKETRKLGWRVQHNLETQDC